MKKIIAVVLTAIIFTGIILVLSQHAMPSSGLYPFKRIYEKAILLTKQDPQEKTEYYQQLLSERLIELNSAYHSTDAYSMLSSSLRYSTTAGNMANIISSNHLSSHVTSSDTLFNKHKSSITYLLNHYSGPERKYLIDDINYLNHYQEVIDAIK